MRNPLDTPFQLTKRGGFGLSCDHFGVALGPVALVERTTERGRHVYRRRPAAEIIRALMIGYGPIEASDLMSRLTSLDVATKALNHRDMARASVATVLLKLPPLSPQALAKLTSDPTLKKYSPDQLRDEHGRWTSGAGDAAAALSGGHEAADASTTSTKPVQIADAGNQMSDAGGILPAPAEDSSGEAPALPPPAGTGVVREYPPEEAAKLPPPPPGSKYVTLKDGSVLWTEPFRSIKGGPMLMPDDVSLAENAGKGQALTVYDQLPPSSEPEPGIITPKDSAMIGLFAPNIGSMDYQRIYSKDGEHINRDYIDFGNYNYGVVAAAAGYSFDEARWAAGQANRLGSGDKSLPDHNNPRNLAMIKKGYDDYLAGRIVPLPKN